MVFSVAADKMVIVDGKIVTFKAGEFETTDKDLIGKLEKIKGFSEVKKAKSSK